MKIEGKILEELKAQTKYPYFGVSTTGRIVLFFAPKTGIGVEGKSVSVPNGKLHYDWDESLFNQIKYSCTFTFE